MDAEKTGGFIAELRKEKGLTQRDLAELLSVSDKAVSRWETGRGFPDLDSLESLSEKLEISIAELLKGRRFDQSVPKEDVSEITADSLTMIRSLLSKSRLLNFLAGLILSLILFTVVWIHLNSPIYISGAKDALRVETLSDGSVVAVLGSDVAGYELDPAGKTEDGKDCFEISCYRTKWDLLRPEKKETVVMLGDRDALGRVSYYPAPDGNELLYGEWEDGSVQTLPRLIYNYWILIGAGLTAAGAVFYLFMRKKRIAGILLRAVMLPLSFTVSTFICLIGRFSEVYNAMFFFSGILLTTFFLYLLALILVKRFEKRKKRQK